MKELYVVEVADQGKENWVFHSVRYTKRDAIVRAEKMRRAGDGSHRYRVIEFRRVEKRG